MKFLCDVHIPIALVKFLALQGYETLHVNSMPNKWNISDTDICNYTDANDFIVTTKDQDFKNTHFILGTPKKLIRITLGNISTTELIAIFQRHLPQFFIHSNGAKCYIEIGKEFIEQNNL
ncbi:MAG: hypothetical protein EAY81_09050 [Bacteroidetes bacterium]|nr:MAG: hypothetical protein EAY81_09050 [Bacteroidota bacterium]